MLNWLNNMQGWAAFVLRVALGTTMAYYGYEKLVPQGGWHHGSAMGGLDHFAHYVATLHMPYWLGYVSVAVEFLGGIFVTLGLLTRLSSFAILINMLVALIAVNIYEGYKGSQLTLLLLAMAFTVLCYGPGLLALDNRLGVE